MTEDVRWLTAEEQKAWRTFIDANSVLLAKLDKQLRDDSDISLAHYDVLVRLSEAPERSLRMRALADTSNASASRISHAVSALEKRGWVRRHVIDDDRRGTIATLTDEGFTALKAAAPGHVEAVRRMLIDRLTQEQVQQLGEIFSSVMKGFASECEREDPLRPV